MRDLNFKRTLKLKHVSFSVILRALLQHFVFRL